MVLAACLPTWVGEHLWKDLILRATNWFKLLPFFFSSVSVGKIWFWELVMGRSLILPGFLLGGGFRLVDVSMLLHVISPFWHLVPCLVYSSVLTDIDVRELWDLIAIYVYFLFTWKGRKLLLEGTLFAFKDWIQFNFKNIIE